MANKHMKRCPALLIIREMQIKIIMSYLVSVRMTIIKNLQTINAGENMEKREPLVLLVGMQIDTATMENSMEIPSNTRSKTTI